MDQNKPFDPVKAKTKTVEQSSDNLLGALPSAGLVGVGVWMVRAAIVDPEPTSKLSLLIGGGVLCIVGGGFSAIRNMGGQAPNVSVGSQEFEVRW